MLKALKSTGSNREDIDWVIPHQASKKAIDAYITAGGFKKEKVINIIKQNNKIEVLPARSNGFE